MNGRPLDFIGAMEAAYDRTLDDDAWLADLNRLIGPHYGASNHTTLAYFFAFRPETGMQLSGVNSSAEPAYTLEHLSRAHDEGARVVGPVAEEALRSVYECDMFTLLSRVVGRDAAKASFDSARMAGFDSLGLRSNITPDSGVMMMSMVDEGYRIRNRSLWTRLAAHIGAAGRLRQQEKRPAPENALAVLTPRGRLEHGTDETIAAREDLGEAAQSMDRARGKMRRLDPDAASALWRTMVRGSWSLVDWFDHDGKRFLLAQDNRIAKAPRRQLTTREEQAVACAAMGHSNKLIAYDLGLSPGTVAVLLARASEKLGVSSRAMLIRAYREAARPPDDAKRKATQ